MSLRRSTGQIHYGSLTRKQQQQDNALINGCFRVWQRGETITAATDFPNTTENYCADRWCFIADAADVADLSREVTVVPDGFDSAFHFDVETANNKFGIFQVIEAQNCEHLIDGENGTVNLSLYARTNAGPEVENIRMAVLSWDGAADTVTDVVAAWNAEGTEPTWGANWTREGGAPANLVLTAAYQRFTMRNIAIDTAGVENIAVVIWVDDTDCLVGDDLYIAGVQLEKAHADRGVSDFVHRPIGYELNLCKRYFEKTFEDGVTPQQGLGAGAGGEFTFVSFVGGDDEWHMWQYRVQKFAVPTIVTYSPTAATAQWRNETAGDFHPIGTAQSTTQSLVLLCDHVAVTETISHGDVISVHITAEAEL